MAEKRICRWCGGPAKYKGFRDTFDGYAHKETCSYMTKVVPKGRATMRQNLEQSGMSEDEKAEEMKKYFEKKHFDI